MNNLCLFKNMNRCCYTCNYPVTYLNNGMPDTQGQISPNGGLLGYTDFYSLMPGDNTALLLQGQM